MEVVVSKGYDIKNSYAFDISEYMQKQNNCGKCVIAFVRKETEKAFLIEELFGYRRKMWFPKSQISLTPQKHCYDTIDCYKCSLYDNCKIKGKKYPIERDFGFNPLGDE